MLSGEWLRACDALSGEWLRACDVLSGEWLRACDALSGEWLRACDALSVARPPLCSLPGVVPGLVRSRQLTAVEGVMWTLLKATARTISVESQSVFTLRSVAGAPRRGTHIRSPDSHDPGRFPTAPFRGCAAWTLTSHVLTHRGCGKGTLYTTHPPAAITSDDVRNEERGASGI